MTTDHRRWTTGDVHHFHCALCVERMDDSDANDAYRAEDLAELEEWMRVAAALGAQMARSCQPPEGKEYRRIMSVSWEQRNFTRMVRARLSAY
jgi:hypothetical protein